jgi:hypothetical protein
VRQARSAARAAVRAAAASDMLMSKLQAALEDTACRNQTRRLLLHADKNQQTEWSAFGKG